MAVSTIDRRGLTELTTTLVELRDRIERQGRSAATVRLAIDRVFVIKGRGTVVTGSLRGGRLSRGDQLRLVPADRTIRAREVQVHGSAVEMVSGGGRVAVNLAGAEAGDAPSG